ncbi:glycosyltransferase family 2 protein [Paenibacillus sp. QZ-Y1]|uniref:glycosyltransferase family 2 protein n=1 Tax=Paenibacillus sp. QZ-Y1 TaxID=3414511 RepID=UPI003F78C27E
MCNEKILLFIPMYNCERQITRVLDQLDDMVQTHINEVIIVNNRSTDNGELAVASYLNKNKKKIPVNLLRNKDNYGLGGSHKVAINYALKNEFDYLVVLHGDDQGRIQDLMPYIMNGDYRKYDSFLGARFKKGASLRGYSAFRTFGNRVYNLLFSMVAAKKIEDLGSGLNCYKVSSLKDEFYHRFPDNLTFNYCMILGSVYRQQKIEFFPITWREDDQVSNVKMVSQAFKVLILLFKYLFNKKVFLEQEHREKIIENYEADLILKKEPQTL